MKKNELSKETLNRNKKEHPVAHRLATVIAVALGVILLVLLWTTVVLSIAGITWLVLTPMLGLAIPFNIVLGLAVLTGMVGTLFGLFQK